MPPLSRRSSRPLYLQISDDLRKQIMQQELRPGERLASEHALMERYGASRQTARKAVAVLKSEGLLDAAQGQGVFVRKRAPLVRRLSRREWETDRSGGFVFDLPATGTTVVEKEHGRIAAPAAVASRLGLSEGTEVTVWKWRVLRGDRPLLLSTSYLPSAPPGRMSSACRPCCGSPEFSGKRLRRRGPGARTTRARVRRGRARRQILHDSAFARLQARFETMPVIEQAKGIIMAQQQCGPGEAFDLLRQASQRANIKVHMLAAQVVEHVAASSDGDNVTAIALGAVR